MDPVTINLNGLSEFAAQFGPFGYLIGHGLTAMFFGIVAWRNIGVAGTCNGLAYRDRNNALSKEEKQQATQCEVYITRSIVSGFVGVVNFIIAIVVSVNLFCVALDRAKTNSQLPVAATVADVGLLPSLGANLVVDNDCLDTHQHPYSVTTKEGNNYSITTYRPLSKELSELLTKFAGQWANLEGRQFRDSFLDQCNSRGICVVKVIRNGLRLFDVTAARNF